MAPRKKAGRQAIADVLGAAPVRRALYLRVSTEDQAERGTIKPQMDFLRARLELDNKSREMQGLPPIINAGEYLDDGVSGAVALGDRPQGHQLLVDAKAGLFDSVLVYRLDRLGRSLRVLMEAHDSLEDAGCTVISATEPFDTSTPFGTAMFQFLGLMAQLEKSTIADRMNSGRDTAIRGGKWTNGCVPFGYDTDAEGRLVVSERPVPGTGMTESEIAREMFRRMAERDGETLVGLCRWLQALGVPTGTRFANGKPWGYRAPEWRPARIHQMLHNTTYIGSRTYNSRLGPITQETPALVTPEMRERALARLAGNLKKPVNATRFNILRGLMECGQCGLAYVGCKVSRAGGRVDYYYRCNGAITNGGLDPKDRCKGKMVPADEVEGKILDYVRRFIRDPGKALEDARQATRDRVTQAAVLEAQRETLTRRVKELTGERERVMTLYKRGMIQLEEAEAQLQETATNLGTARAELEALRAQQALAEAAETRLLDAATALARITENFELMPQEKKAEVLGLLVPRIVVHTIDLERKRGRESKTYHLEAQVIVGDATEIGAAKDAALDVVGSTEQTTAMPRRQRSTGRCR